MAAQSCTVDVDALPINDAKFIVIGGHGGVGKTTLSAAIALSQALRGKRVGVLTIDPARRLGAALGLRKLENKIRWIDPKKLDPFRKAQGGALAAAMLDVKATFDEMVRTYAPTPAIAKRVIDNRMYQQLSQSLSGTHEYMALERIYQMKSSGEFDCLIVDTPPTSAFVDFLKAPERLRNFFSAEVARWFMPKMATSPLGFGIGWAFSLFKKLAGGGVLLEVSEFLTDFQTMFDSLILRVKTIEGLLTDPHSKFLYIITSDSIAPPELPPSLELTAFILNRAIPTNDKTIAVDADVRLVKAAEVLRKRQRKVLAMLKKEFPKVPVVQVPLQEKDPATLAALAGLFS